MTDSFIIQKFIFLFLGINERGLNFFGYRILLVSILLLTIMIFNSYSAAIISFFITHENSLPFNGVQGFLDYGKYLIRVQSISPILKIIKVNISKYNFMY